ncbi:hypothetical protein NUACC21_68430 [Scytonema sp. NUACC21]
MKKEGVAGRIHQQLMSIVCKTPSREGNNYLTGEQYSHYIPNETKIKNSIQKLCEELKLTTPNEPLPNDGVLGFRVLQPTYDHHYSSFDKIFQ